jgi:hypothetical protein
VNTAARVVGNQTLRGHLSTMKTIMVWEGGDDYKTVLTKMKGCCLKLKEMQARGYVDTKHGRTDFKIIGGGDMLWINDLLLVSVGLPASTSAAGVFARTSSSACLAWLRRGHSATATFVRTWRRLAKATRSSVHTVTRLSPRRSPRSRVERRRMD